MTARTQRVTGDGARARVEWPTLAATSEASVYGWTEATRPWWHGMELEAFEGRVASMTGDEVMLLQGELKKVRAQLARVANGMSGSGPWVAYAQRAIEDVSLLRRVVTNRMTVLHRAWDERGEIRRKERLARIEEAEKLWKAGRADEAFAALVSVLRHANGGEP